ncbi:MAG: hypothetical protein BYD32DRAFT_237702 [Podila humilis]|nr:MAG: hypothetical protein BYD32DRAFT_237702 [Podila humilis]
MSWKKSIMRTDLSFLKLGHKARHRCRRLHPRSFHHPLARSVLLPRLAMHTLKPHHLPRHLPQRIVDHTRHDPIACRLGRQPVPDRATPHRRLAAVAKRMAAHGHTLFLVVERVHTHQPHYRALGRRTDRPGIGKAAFGTPGFVASGEGLGACEREREGHVGGVQAEGDGVSEVKDAVELQCVGDGEGGEVEILGDSVRAHIADRGCWVCWLGEG